MENLIERLTDHPLSATMDDIEILIKRIRELETQLKEANGLTQQVPTENAG